MQSGIARQMANKWPPLESAYDSVCLSRLMEPGRFFVWGGLTPEVPLIFNLGTQRNPGADAKLVWISMALANCFDFMEERGLETLAIPRIGCGVGGLKWEDVSKVLTVVASQTTVELTVVTLPEKETSESERT